MYQELADAVHLQCQRLGCKSTEMQSAFLAAACSYASQGNSVNESVRKSFAIPAQGSASHTQLQTAANSEAVSRTAQHLGSEASQAMSPTPPTAPPTANQCLAQAHHTVDGLQPQLHATALLAWHENSSSSSSRIQRMKESAPWRKKEQPANDVKDVKDGTNEDNPFDFESCLHKAMPAEGSEVFGNA